MFELSAKKVDFEKQNTIIKRNINLDTNLDCFILISSSNDKLAENILNNTLEFLIDKISKKETYNDFSIALEHINSYLNTWRLDQKKQDSLDMIIWILNENNYIFSNIWKSSLFLLNKNSEVLELTEKKENKTDFSYISSWNIVNWEIIISSTINLLKYLSKSDLSDGLILSEDIKIFNKNIKNILKDEILKENCLVSSLKFISNTYIQKDNKIDTVKDFLIKSMDNRLSKQIIWYFLILKEKILLQSKTVKNIIFLSFIGFFVIFLYYTLSTFVSITTQTEQKEVIKNNIVEIKKILSLASDNVWNPDIFEKNIKDAENMIKDAQKEEIYLNDLAKITDNINILKKQFNKISIFDDSQNNIIFKSNNSDSIKVLENNKKQYILTKKWVICYLNCSNWKEKIYTFNQLNEDEFFSDASFIWTDMYILTNKSKIVKFTKNWYFSYIDVIWQKSWEPSKEINSYASNLYTLENQNSQINKHSSYWNEFKSATKYLKEDDLKEIWEILTIAIDWGFYILKKDLSIVKFFSSPYRLENIVINKLPKNYNYNEWTKIDLKARNDLNYVYLLLNNKIWVFKPNTIKSTSTQSLTYIWQIEWATKQLIDFSINRDWEIMILNTDGVYKLNFEVSDEKIVIR